MPPISYCSLDEAWGIQKKPNKEENNINRFDKLSETSQKERNTVIDNMNYIERNVKNNGNLPDNSEFEVFRKLTQPSVSPEAPHPGQALLEAAEKYRTNSMNKVAPLKSTSTILNDNSNTIEDSKEKQSYKERLAFLENELQKCKKYLEIYKNKENSKDKENIDTIENFQNSNTNNTSNTSNDIIDLIFLIIIGLVIIFIMNSIFKLGKSIGKR